MEFKRVPALPSPPRPPSMHVTALASSRSHCLGRKGAVRRVTSVKMFTQALLPCLPALALRSSLVFTDSFSSHLLCFFSSQSSLVTKMEISFTVCVGVHWWIRLQSDFVTFSVVPMWAINRRRNICLLPLHHHGAPGRDFSSREKRVQKAASL